MHGILEQADGAEKRCVIPPNLAPWTQKKPPPGIPDGGFFTS